MPDSDSECETMPDSGSKCRTALDSASERDMYSMRTIMNYNLSDMTMTNYDKFLILLMQYLQTAAGYGRPHRQY